MDEATSARLFEKYYRRSYAQHTSGFGMYLVKQLVQRMGGTIVVQSTVGEGTTMRFDLPEASPIVASDDTTPSEAPLRVLMVEDDPCVADGNRAVLRKARSDVVVEVVASGDEALERWREGFTLITMDSSLEGALDGAATIQALRSRGCTLPIVSASTDLEPMPDSDDVWSKPWSVRRIRRTLDPTFVRRWRPGPAPSEQ
jgi:CheY-like chemotaxis protein